MTDTQQHQAKEQELVELKKRVAELEQEIHERDEGEIDSRAIGEILMERLKKLDQVAFVRFASVYREFKDVKDFVEELQPMLDGASNRVRDGD